MLKQLVSCVASAHRRIGQRKDERTYKLWQLLHQSRSILVYTTAKVCLEDRKSEIVKVSGFWTLNKKKSGRGNWRLGCVCLQSCNKKIEDGNDLRNKLHEFSQGCTVRILGVGKGGGGEGSHLPPLEVQGGVTRYL